MGGRLEPVPLPAGVGGVRALLPDNRERLWDGTDGGLWLLAPRGGGGFSAPVAVAQRAVQAAIGLAAGSA